MEIVKFPIGSVANADISISGGNVVIAIQIAAKPEVDALLQALKAKLPASVQPLVDLAQAAVDAELSKP